MASDDEKGFDLFELFSAIMLGLGAIGSAWAAYQGDLWDGNSTEAYGEASTMSTRASTVFNTGLSGVIRDMNLDVEAKKQVFEALYTPDEAARERTLDTARWLFTTQLSEEAYGTLGLPPEPRAHVLAQRASIAAQMAGQAPADPAQAAAEAEGPQLTPEQMTATFFRDLAEDETYLAATLGDGVQMFDAADAKFTEGREANQAGDEFGMAAILYTVALFLSGIALVFKSGIKWAFGGLGAIVVVAATMFLFTLEWAPAGGDGDAPAAVPAEAAPAAAPAAPAQ